MNEKKPDRRTLKTKKAICDAFAELLGSKPLHKVTVQEIADKADVNRVTFYKHYLDVYDLYEKMEQEFFVDIGMLVLRLEEMPREDFFRSLTDYVNENRSIFTMIFSSNVTAQMRNKLYKIMEGLFRTIMGENENTELTKKDLEYLGCCRAQVCLGVISKWVTEGYEESQDYIIKTVTAFDNSIAEISDKQVIKARAKKK